VVELKGPASQLRDRGFGSCVDEILGRLLSSSRTNTVSSDISLDAGARHGEVGTTLSAPGQQAPPQNGVNLSYNQINCLENVHRLLRSQSSDSGASSQSSRSSPADPYTRPTKELLQLHDRKWEEDCKDTWKRRLSTKRPQGRESHGPPPKVAKKEGCSGVGIAGGTRVASDQVNLIAQLQQQSTIALWNNYVSALQGLLARTAAVPREGENR
jgi:hypothetical protein